MATEHRLPDTVRPEKYSIELRPNLKAFSFEGSESIRIQVARPTKTIVLNAEGLEVREATVSSSKGGSLPATSIDFDSKREVLRLDFAESVPSGPATLRLSFSGTLNDELAGFYRSRYTMSDGKQGYMAATQFESTNARRAFPCWDEPAAKATFEVSLVVPDGMTAVSNTPAIDEKDLGDGTRLVRFAETPRMSTYLLAFAVGPLDSIEGKARRGTKLGVWALPDRIGHSRWALDEAIRILDYLNDYYGIPYPLEKLDHIALQDFAAGAMENWGAITYRERILLFDPATSSAQTRQTIVEVIAHETAHMWFGDLVTMAWWDDLWLNESFASWMGAKTTGALHPEWKMWTQFLEEDIVRGLALDGLTQSRFLYSDILGPSKDRTRWKVPVRIARAGQKKPVSFLMEKKTESRPLGRSRRSADKDWIKVNAGQSGFYRVNYPPEEWDRLRRAVEAGELGTEDRSGLQNDAHALMRAGYLPATTLLDLTAAYRGEDDATGWRLIAESLHDVETLISDTRYLEKFDAYGRELFRRAGEQSGWDPKPREGHLDALKRSTVLGRLGHHSYRPVLAEAGRRFARYLKDPSTLHPDLRGVVYNLVGQQADQATYETLWELQRKAALQEEQVRRLMALSHPRDERLLQETLRRSLTDAVRSQDAVLVITTVAASRPSVGRDLAWSFVKDNWDELYRRYAESGFLIRRLVQMPQGFTTPAAVKDVERFFRGREAPEVRRTVPQSIEKIRVNAAWLKNNGKDLARWFATRSS